MWCVYLIECRNGAWYAGITNDLDARYAAASKAEYEVKRLPKARKLAWLNARDGA
jgi:putative endonuclease